MKVSQIVTKMACIINIHIQPMLLGMISRDTKNDAVMKYISCHKFRARVKAHCFGNLVNIFNSEEVCFHQLYLVHAYAKYCVVYSELCSCNSYLKLLCFGFIVDVLLPEVCIMLSHTKIIYFTMCIMFVVFIILLGGNSLHNESLWSNI